MWTLYSLLLLLIALPVLADAAPPRQESDLNVMSFNIRYANEKDGEDRWEVRKDFLYEVIRKHDPDVIGVQEALRSQLDQMGVALPQYAQIGVGRSDGKSEGEHSSLLYRKDRFEVDEQGNFWFSETPEVPGSKDWGNSITRICTWARLKDRKTGKAFYVYNLHIDHQSQPSREKSVVLLGKRIKERKHPDPVIVTGDFNAGEDNPAIKTMKADVTPRLRDSFRVLHPGEMVVGTFHGFKGGTVGDKIDYVFVTDEFKVLDAQIIRDNRNGRYPSDHFPVTARLQWEDCGCEE